MQPLHGSCTRLTIFAAGRAGRWLIRVGARCRRLAVTALVVTWFPVLSAIPPAHAGPINILDFSYAGRSSANPADEAGVSNVQLSLAGGTSILVGDSATLNISFDYTSESEASTPLVVCLQDDPSVTINLSVGGVRKATATRQISGETKRYRYTATIEGADVTSSVSIQVSVSEGHLGVCAFSDCSDQGICDLFDCLTTGYDCSSTSDCLSVSCPPFCVLCEHCACPEEKVTGAQHALAVSVENPITVESDPIDPGVFHGIATGREAETRIRNFSSRSFHLRYVLSADNLWDADCVGVVAGRGNDPSSHLAFNVCVTHDTPYECAAPHALGTSWDEYTEFAGVMFLSRGRWAHTGSDCETHFCCGTEDPCLSTCTNVLNDCPQQGSPTEVFGIRVGPLIEPSISIPLPFSFVVHEPLPAIDAQTRRDCGRDSRTIDDALVSQIRDDLADLPIPDMTIEVRPPSSLPVSKNQCDADCANPDIPCVKDQCPTLPPCKSCNDITNEFGIAEISATFFSGTAVQVTIPETIYYEERVLLYPVIPPGGESVPILAVPKMAPTVIGTLLLPDGRNANGSVYVEARTELASRVTAFDDNELERLGVPFDNPLVTINRNRVLIPLGRVVDGTIGVPQRELRLLGFPTANLVFRAPYSNPLGDGFFENLEASVNINTREATGVGDTINVGIVQLNVTGESPVTLDCAPPIPAQHEWGLVALSLLLLVAGSIIVGRVKESQGARCLPSP